MTKRVWWYRLAIAILVLGEGYLMVSGRLPASWRFIATPPAATDDAEFFRHFATNVMYLAFLAPIVLTVVWVANRDRSATAGAAYWRAIKTVFVVAWKGDVAPPLDDDVADTVAEEPLGALMKGIGVAALFASFFWFGPAPIGHTVRTALWLVLTGVLLGGTIYCVERARPFLRPSWHEAQRGRLLRRWWSPYPISYDQPGDRWIRWHWLLVVLAAVCWLGGFALLPNGVP